MVCCAGAVPLIGIAFAWMCIQKLHLLVIAVGPNYFWRGREMAIMLHVTHHVMHSSAKHASADQAFR